MAGLMGPDPLQRQAVTFFDNDHTIGNPVAPGETSSGGHGMALGNIRERLALAFGSRASLVTHSDRERFYAVLSVPHVRHIDR